MARAFLLIIFTFCIVFSANGAALFEENWDAAGAAGLVDSGVWNLDQGDAAEDMYIFEDLGGGDYAMRCWTLGGDEDNSDCGCNWSGHLYSIPTFGRGDDIRCTFCFWGNPVTVDWPTPNGAVLGQGAMDDSEGAGLQAPWHLGELPGQPYNSCEACMLMWYNVDKAGSGPLWAHAGRWGDYANSDSSAPFKTAIENAMPNKANALYIRVTLGNTQGALYEYSTDGAQTWIMEADRRDGVDAGAPTTAADLILGFHNVFSIHVLLDNIVVEDNNNIALPAPTATPPPPTSTPNPNTGVTDWEEYE